MSTTTNRRALEHAIIDAQAFRALFTPDTYEHWHFAGSVCRCHADVLLRIASEGASA